MAVFEWQVLRAVLRAGKAAAVGKAFQLVPSRRTKDGSFLTDRVNGGLLQVAKKAGDPFAATYRLTPLGEYAAGRGEYEKAFPPPKVSG